MVRLKKNQLNNILTVMVDKTDFATVESGMSAADINIKMYGVIQGVSTAASTITVSKAATLVRSGIFQITLKASECDTHDLYMLRLSSTSTVSCATQYIPLEMVDNDDSDVHSFLAALSGVLSDIDSALTSQFNVVSNYLSNASNYLSNISAMVSDVDSAVNSQYSDVASKVLASTSLISDVDSALTSQFAVVSNYLSNISDQVSNVDSALNSQFAVVSNYLSNISDQVSNVDSALNSQFAVTSNYFSNASNYLSNISALLSDVDSAANSQYSDLASKIGAITVTLTASDLSDIASAVIAGGVPTTSAIAAKVWSDYGSKVGATPSKVYSQLQSMVMFNTSAISDLDSALTSQFAVASNYFSNASNYLSNISAMLSDVDSAVSSQYSDVASKVLAATSLISDVDSALTSQFSDVVSKFGALPDKVWSDYTSKVGATPSDVYSTLQSAIAAGGGGGVTASAVAARVWSDYESKVGASPSQVYSQIQSMIGDTYSLLSDLGSDIQSKLSDVSSDIAVMSARLPTRPTKNTALANFMFLMIDSTDHVTPKTGLTITAERSIDGAAFGACSNSVSEISAGLYKINLAAGDLNGDTITFKFSASGADTRYVSMVTQAS